MEEYKYVIKKLIYFKIFLSLREIMYLDTDIVLNAIDKNSIEIDSLFLYEDEIKGSKTSIFTVLEIHDLMQEIEDILDYEALITEIEKEGIDLLSFTPEILATALELEHKYEGILTLQIEHFIHSAHSIHCEEPLISPDPAYEKIEEIELIDLDTANDESNYNFISEDIPEDGLSIL